MARLFDLDNKRKQVKDAAQAYYTDGSSNMADEEFDAAVEELRRANPDDPLVNKVGWGYDVDLDTTPGEKVKHRYGFMGSLKKIHTFEEIQKIFGSLILNVSAKLDGLSCVAYYVNGELVLALTRGDGITGVDITEKFKKLNPDYNLRDKTFTGAIRGELVMLLFRFEQFRVLHPEAKNPRNSAVGLIGKDSMEDIEFVDFVPYTVVGTEYSNLPFTNIYSMRTWLAASFKIIVPDTNISVTYDLTEVRQLFDDWAKTFPIDGLVLTSGYDLVADNGPIEIHYTAQALKFQSEIALAKVINVEWNLGKNHLIVPRVQTEPVQLAGSTVQFATGFNAKFIKENGVGIGAVVELEKRGEIIPCVNRVDEPVMAILPEVCPVCGSSTVWDGVHLICSNDECDGQKDGDLRVWCMTLAPVDGLGWILIKKFCNLLDVHTVEDLMDLDTDDLSRLPIGSQSAMFSEMIRRLNENRFKLATAIEATNIPRFGFKTSAQLAAHPDAFKIILSGVSVRQVCRQINLGDANTDALEENLDKLYRLDMIQDRLIYEEPRQSVVKGKVAITGVLSVSRDKFEEELRDAGYEPAGLTKKSLYLITNTPDSGTTKNQAADKYGVQKITEDEFRRKYLR